MKETPLTPEELERLREALASISYTRLLGIEFDGAERGAATLSMRARPELERFGGIMHGGALASLADSASAFAVLSTLADGEQTVTADLTLHYLRPVTEGKLTARARVLRGGRRVATVSVEIFNESGALVLTALTTYIKLR
ncbi:MAG TPA: PaaI family thioesterase [Pyrinomonadaceae bacterium]|nr:PaaI family thioesterase [Pyrinomonadaceae bacterium]